MTLDDLGLLLRNHNFIVILRFWKATMAK